MASFSAVAADPHRRSAAVESLLAACRPAAASAAACLIALEPALCSSAEAGNSATAATAAAHSDADWSILRAAPCRLQRQSSANSVGSSGGITTEDTSALVQLEADAEGRRAACTRKACCASFEVPPDAATLPLYWCRHQPEKQHFDAPQSDVERSLRAQLKAADAELKQLLKDKEKVDHHIHVLHDYNEIKDVVQALMGKCAELEGRTTKDMYVKFGLDLED